MANKWQIVTIAVTDIWSEPKFESGRVNQAVYGQILREVRHKSAFSFCYCEDNYAGWVRKSHLSDLPGNIEQLKRARVKSYLADIYGSSSSPMPLFRLSYGSTVFYEANSNDLVRLRLPNGWISKADLSLHKNLRPSFNTIQKDLKKFLGTPYLWGGKSAFGIDCSGLVQLVYNMSGFELPRDSKDQAECGRKVARRNLRSGDLIFSPGHVCIYTGNNNILHANARSGFVNIESIDKNSRLYRGDIAENITMIRRIL